MVDIRLRIFSFRFAEQVLNSKLTIKHEIEDSILELNREVPNLSRPKFNEILREK